MRLWHFDFDAPQLACAKGDACEKCHNRIELLYHPQAFKHRFCSSWPHVENCSRGDVCAFAHSRDEVAAPLFTPEEESGGLSEDFFMYKFKTLWCPLGVQHDWHRCLYAHTYQDCRRTPLMGYGSEPCPYWDRNHALTEYSRRCPHGSLCPYAHGSKEQLYHPSYYKTMPCSDFRQSRKCPRGHLCAFYHEKEEQRQSYEVKLSNAPLDTANVQRSEQPAFDTPPLFHIDDDDEPRRFRRPSNASPKPTAPPAPGPSSVKVPSTPPPAPKEEWQMTPKTSNSVTPVIAPSFSVPSTAAKALSATVTPPSEHEPTRTRSPATVSSLLLRVRLSAAQARGAALSRPKRSRAWPRSPQSSRTPRSTAPTTSSHWCWKRAR